MKTSADRVAKPQDLDEEWKQQAFSVLCEFCNKHIGEDHLAEEIRAYADRKGVARLTDALAWGPVFKKAERLGVITQAGYAPTVSSNGSPKVLWKMVGADSTNRCCSSAGGAQ